MNIKHEMFEKSDDLVNCLILKDGKKNIIFMSTDQETDKARYLFFKKDG